MNCKILIAHNSRQIEKNKIDNKNNDQNRERLLVQYHNVPSHSGSIINNLLSLNPSPVNQLTNKVFKNKYDVIIW